MITQEQYVKSNGCRKKVWLLKNKSNEMTENNANLMAISAAEDIREAAKASFGRGISVKNADSRTVKKLLKKHKIIFDGVFESDIGKVRCDITELKRGNVIIYKIRSGAGWENTVKTALFQKAILTSSGYNVSNVYIMSVNPDYVREIRLNYSKLFTFTDITNADKNGNVPSKMRFIAGINRRREEPQTKLNKFCSNCEFFHYCFKDLPSPNIFMLGNIPFEDKMTLYNHGILTYDDYLRLPEINQNCKVQIEAELNDCGIKKFLGNLKYPLGFLDFEAISPAIPRYRGTKSNERILTQFSYHYIEKEGGELKHLEFIGDGIHYPEKELSEKLIEYIGENHCVLMYSPYERNCINSLITKFPKYKNKLMKIRDNLVDLEKPFSSKLLYRKEMHGRSSIKYVLPALYPDDEKFSYKNLSVSNGGF